MRGIYGIEYKGSVVYVGQSVDMQRRFGQHRCTLRNRTHRNFVLQRIYDKRPDSLTFVVLEEVVSADLTAAEASWMERIKPAANLSTAQGAHPHTEDARAKMRAYKRTAEHRAKLSAAAKGRVPATKGRHGVFRHTPEARAKIAAASRGRKATPEQLAARSEKLKGRQFTAEHREKLRQAKLGKLNEAVRQAMTGRKQSPELVAKRVAGFNAAIERRRERAGAAEQQAEDSSG